MKILSVATALAVTSTTSGVCAFTAQSSVSAFMGMSNVGNRGIIALQASQNSPFEEKEDPMFDPLHLSSSSEHNKEVSFPAVVKVSAAALTMWSMGAAPSMAAGPDWGIFEGRSLSLLHPIMMGSMLIFSLYTALLGFNWRRQRTMGDDISALKKTLPSFSGSSLSEAISAAKAADTVDSALVSKLQAALPIESDIKALTAERKELSSQNNRERHWSQGSLLAFIGTTFAIEGPLNTYARAGKLFPGPHLYAGAGLVVLWAAAAACVPAMQKGSDTARSIHIGANVAGIGLFGWQVVSGFPILLKVLEKTSWP